MTEPLDLDLIRKRALLLYTGWPDGTIRALCDEIATLRTQLADTERERDRVQRITEQATADFVARRVAERDALQARIAAALDLIDEFDAHGLLDVTRLKNDLRRALEGQTP